MMLSFVAVILTGSVISSHADVPSPKKQLDSGVAPENVQCRKNLVLVMRDSGEIACVREATADKVKWKMITNNLTANVSTKDDSILDKGKASPSENGVPSHADDILLNSTNITVRSDEPYDDQGIPYGLYTEQNKRVPASTPLNEDQYPEIEIDENGNLVLPRVKRSIASGDDGMSMNDDKNPIPRDWIPSYIPAGQELKVIQWQGYDGQNDWMEIAYAPNTASLNASSYRSEF